MRNKTHRHRRQKHCGEKRCYLTREDACHNMLLLANRPDRAAGPLNVYRCETCQEFHVGRIPPAIRERYQLG